MFVIHPEHVSEVLDRLCGSNLSGENKEPLGSQDNMYRFFDRDQMTEHEIEELEKHRT